MPLIMPEVSKSLTIFLPINLKISPSDVIIETCLENRGTRPPPGCFGIIERVTDDRRNLKTD
jgi:hypothetical protein